MKTTNNRQFATGNRQFAIRAKAVLIFVFFFFLSSFEFGAWDLGLGTCSAQNVGISTTGSTPNASALLDIDAAPNNNRGLLIPRVTFAERTGVNFSPLPAIAQGLLVYQTNADGDGEGYYYNTSATTTPAWVKLFSSTTGWSLTGNTGTNSGTNFLGTTDNVSLRIRTNNTEKMVIDSLGNVGIGTAIPAVSAALDVTSTTKGFLPPRMTTAQRDAIALPVHSLLIYNTTTDCFEAYNANTLQWVAFGCLGCQLPGAFSATAATGITTTSFSANWTASGGTTTYFLDVSTVSNFATFVTGYNNLNAGNVTTYSVNTNLTCETTYYYRLRANNSCGTTAYSNTITVTTSSCCPLLWSNTGIPFGNSDYANGITADASGIYVAGQVDAPSLDWRIEKRDLNTGALITGFGIGGVVTRPDGDYVYGITADTSGIYVAGYDNNPGNAQWRIEKYSLTGVLIWADTSNPSPNFDQPHAITADTSGIYVVGRDRILGPGSDQWRIEKRDLTTGALITGFGTGGVINTGSTAAGAITVDASGIYVAGTNAGGGAQWSIEKRNLTTGDTIWTVLTNPTANEDGARAIAVDASGIYVAGNQNGPTTGTWRIEKRNLSTGDTIWTQTSNPSTGDNGPGGITIDATGIYVAGFDNGPGNLEWRIEKRNLTTGALITTFGTLGVYTSNPTGIGDHAYGITQDASGIYVAGDENTPPNAKWRIEKICK